MGQDSKIQWTHHTLNPWRGCSKAHAGCTNCYAEKNVGVKMNGITWGEVWQGGQRVVAADSAWEHPPRWARAAANAGERRRVFCASLADVLDVPADPPDALHDGGTAARRVAEARDALSSARDRLWSAIRQTAVLDAKGRAPERPERAAEYMGQGWPGLDWLLLTKRPENWRLVPEDVRPLVWLGTSISDQKTADEWVPRLLQAEGFRLRFLSVEPLVGPVDLSDIPDGEGGVWKPLAGLRWRPLRQGGLIPHPVPRIDWVIVGGESGPKARPCNVEWVRDIVRQCREAGVPVFCKQMGSEWARSSGGDAKGGDMALWPADIQTREFPEAHR